MLLRISILLSIGFCPFVILIFFISIAKDLLFINIFIASLEYSIPLEFPLGIVNAFSFKDVLKASDSE